MMCEGLGQKDPEGILWLTETVPVFQCNSEMMAIMHHLIVATVWHGKPIVLHIWPLNTKQVRDYIAVRSSPPSGASVQAPDEGVEAKPPPSKTEPR